MSPLPMPLIKAQESDTNSDGKVDNYRLIIQFKTDPSQIRHVDVYGGFDYYLGEKLKMQMVGIINMSVQCPIGAAKIMGEG